MARAVAGGKARRRGRPEQAPRGGQGVGQAGAVPAAASAGRGGEPGFEAGGVGGPRADDEKRGKKGDQSNMKKRAVFIPFSLSLLFFSLSLTCAQLRPASEAAGRDRQQAQIPQAPSCPPPRHSTICPPTAR